MHTIRFNGISLASIWILFLAHPFNEGIVMLGLNFMQGIGFKCSLRQAQGLPLSLVAINLQNVLKSS